MCVLGVIFNRKKIMKDNSIFFLTLIMVTFGVYSLIEIQPRYTYFIHISLFVMSCYGYDLLIEKLKKIKFIKKRFF